jgi:two-component system, NarL family, nitrate/nitrite response regulator NarL
MPRPVAARPVPKTGDVAGLQENPMNNVPNLFRIVIADENRVFRQDLRRLLESAHGLRIVGEASDASGAVQLMRQIKPEILLIDLALFRLLELHAPNGSSSHLPAVRILVMLTTIDKAHMVEAFRFGAHGIVLKSATPPVLLSSLRSVMAGQYWLESESVAILVEALRESLAQANGNKSPKDYGLTRREIEIVTKISSGSSNREVGQQFAISERTVKHHLTNIFSKVGVSSRLQLALFAVNHNLMSNPPSLSLQTQVDDEV